MKKSVKKHILRIVIIFFSVVFAIGIFFVVSNLLIINSGEKKLVSDAELKELDADCIIVLGAGVWGDDPSPILSDRLDEGLRLYNEGVAPKILVSGDHGRVNYDEVNVMKQYLIDAGVPSEDIFMDHAGFSTYESIYRAKEVFCVEKAVVVTQKYHIYRAMYICDKLGIEVLGSNSDPRRYKGQEYLSFREWIARDKDIFSCLFKVKPTYLGKQIDIHGSGDATNDK